MCQPKGLLKVYIFYMQLIYVYKLPVFKTVPGVACIMGWPYGKESVWSDIR